MRSFPHPLWFLMCAAALLLSAACAVSRSEAPVKLALLAPFEGRYREVGYNALYAARLALRDSLQAASFELLPIDDGGTPQQAAVRAQALAGDPQVVALLTLGYAATSAEAQSAKQDLPMLIVGHWDAAPTAGQVFLLSSASLREHLTLPERVEVEAIPAAVDAVFVGGDILALQQVPHLYPDLDGITVISNSILADEIFIARYRQYDQFAPQPGLLSTLVYDAVSIIIDSSANSVSRAALAQALARQPFVGLNGEIRFQAGYWANAPLHYYRYKEGQLIPIEGVVE